MNWFKVTLLAPDTWQISEPLGKIEPRIGIGTVNMFLVAGRERAALIDSGMGIGDLHATVRELTTLPILVCNTHWHWDHSASNHQFAQIAIHQIEYELLKQEQSVKSIRKQMARPEVRAILPPDFDPESYRIVGTTATHTLCDTDKLDLGGRMLHVLHTPGHSAGHVAYFDADNGILFSGDTAYRGPMFACFEGSDPAAFACSAQRLAQMADGVQCIAPGHNDTLAGGAFLRAVADAADAALNADVAALPYNDFMRGHEFNAAEFSILLPKPQAAI